MHKYLPDWIKPPQPMTTPTTRTPQQASIEAREAREAWEITGQAYWSTDKKEWLLYTGEHPDFLNVGLYWRGAKLTPVITPGKWRMRNGEVVEIEARRYDIWRWKESNGNRTWDEHGFYLASKRQQHRWDLLTRVETRWRPWKPEEVPLGGVARRKDEHSTRVLITGSTHVGFGFNLIVVSAETAFDEWELLFPDGTYSPCGVEEEVG